jgi:hypothetical protein
MLQYSFVRDVGPTRHRAGASSVCLTGGVEHGRSGGDHDAKQAINQASDAGNFMVWEAISSA